MVEAQGADELDLQLDHQSSSSERSVFAITDPSHGLSLQITARGLRPGHGEFTQRPTQ